MSFGFAVGDFVQVGTLAWSLYRDCYKVARDAPQDFQLLVNEMKRCRIQNQQSAQGGEQRVQLVNEMVENIRGTLLSLKKYTTKYEISGSNAGSKLQLRQKVRDFKWSVHRKSIDELRGRIHQHNGLLTLLLTSAGNSSLQRIQNTTNVLDENVRFIRQAIAGQQGGKDLLAPCLSLVDDEELRSSISATLMKNAEIDQPWTTIGVTQWIDTGRWWLQGFELGLDRAPAGTREVSTPVYTSLIKASWILVDIVACHPQITFVSSPTRLQISALCFSIRKNLERIGELGLTIPSLNQICQNDLRIWQNRAAATTPTRSRRSILGKRVSRDTWIVEGKELALFVQRGSLASRAISNAIVCDVLVLIDLQATKTRLLCIDQAQQTLLEVDLTSDSWASSHENHGPIVVKDCTILLKQHEDILLLNTIAETSKIYYNERERSRLSIEGLLVYFCLLLARHQASGRDVPTFDPEVFETHPSNQDPVARNLKSATLRLYASTPVVEKNLPGDLRLRQCDMNLLAWMIVNDQTELVRSLLADNLHFGLHASRHIHAIMLAAACAHRDVIELLIADAKRSDTWRLDINRRDEFSRTALHYASIHGNWEAAELLLDNEAEIDSKQNGWTPRHYNGAEIDSNANGRTPLHYASRHGWPKTVQILVSKGADLEAPTESGITPSMVALQNCQDSVVKVLLNAGARVEAHDICGAKSFHYALDWRNRKRPVSQETFDMIYSKWKMEAFPSELQEGPVHAVQVRFEMDAPEGVIFIESPSATIRGVDGVVPKFARSIYDRLFVVKDTDNNRNEENFVEIVFDITFRDPQLNIALTHEAWVTASGSSVLYIERLETRHLDSESYRSFCRPDGDRFLDRIEYRVK